MYSEKPTSLKIQILSGGEVLACACASIIMLLMVMVMTFTEYVLNVVADSILMHELY
jgi:hypothetical protein